MNSDIRRVFFIVNRFSGTGFKAALESEIVAACVGNGVTCSLAYTEHRGHATVLARHAVAQGYDKVVAVGGDGTVNEVAQGILNTSAAMGIIPKGSGNGLARHLQIPLRLDLALKCLFTSTVIAMDAFRMNDRLSLNVSGIGFDGYIAELFRMDKTRGLQGYTRLVLNEFMQYPEFDATLQIGDDTIQKRGFVIAVANSSQYGNNAKIAPSASVCDGLLNISVLKKMPPYRLDFIYSFFAGTIDQSAYCENFHARDFSIQLNKPVAFHIDGEPSGTADHFKIEMLRAALNILTPRSPRPEL